MEKISLVDTLGKEEQQTISKMIDLAVSNKKLKDNLQSLIGSVKKIYELHAQDNICNVFAY